MITVIAMGTLGGLVRSLVGIAKRLDRSEPDGPRIRVGYLAASIFAAAATGALAGALCGGDWRLAALAGYAGSDFLDSLYQLRMRRRLPS